MLDKEECHKAVRLFWQAGIFNQCDKPEIRKEYGCAD